MSLSKSKTTTALLALGGAAIAGAALYWLFSEDDEGSSSNQGPIGTAPANAMTPEETLGVAKKLNRALFPAYDAVCQMARQMIMMMCMQTGMNPSTMPPQLKQQIFEECVSRSKWVADPRPNVRAESEGSGGDLLHFEPN
jgi:hypothetical protein